MLPSLLLLLLSSCSWHSLLRLAGPLMVQSLSTMAMILISTTFVGHLNNPTELSAVVLASSLYNVTGSSLIIGLSSGMETLCGQVGCCWLWVAAFTERLLEQQQQQQQQQQQESSSSIHDALWAGAPLLAVASCPSRTASAAATGSSNSSTVHDSGVAPFVLVEVQHSPLVHTLPC
jgi:hypothetical protein